jgi:spermidine synthase
MAPSESVTNDDPVTPPFLSIALVSAAALGYQVLLLRLFSIIQWHHFAYMVISLALLGFGASGTVIALARHRLLPHFRAAFATGAAGFGLTAVASFAIAQRIPFNALEVIWEPRQQLYLALLFLLLAVPFFGAALAIGLALAAHGKRIASLYRADLLGAGLGALAVIGTLFLVMPTTMLRLVGGAGVIAAALVFADLPGRRLAVLGLTGLALAALALLPEGLLRPQLSPYKSLMQTLVLPDARIIARRSSPLGRLDVVESPAAPLRHAPGLSLNATAAIPPQLGVFTDGDGMTAITRFDGDRDSLAFLDWQAGALPYHLTHRPRVLVLGAGGGSEILRAQYHGARRIDAVELNPQMAELLDGEQAEFAGHLFRQPGSHLHIAEARAFAARNDRRYDLIQITLLDSFAASAAGLHALSESTLYTLEAFETYLDRLAPGGMLAITRWLRLPPRDSLKLFATAVEVLRRRGADDPSRQLLLMRSWDTATLIVKSAAFAPIELAAARRFADERLFDLAYYPGMPAGEANRHNVLEQPYLFEGTRALLGPAPQAFLDAYRFDLTPASDDRPYFFHFFKWRLLPELSRLGPAGGVLLLDWGYMVLWATLGQAVAISVLLILLPLRALGGEGATAPVGYAARVAVYFLALGLAFLFIEIAFIQRFVLFLGHPLTAVSVVLCSFLVFAGFGSGFAGRLPTLLAGRRIGAIPLAVGGIVGIAGIYLLLLPALFGWLSPLTQGARIPAAIVLIAPLAFCMGLPFPLALRQVADKAAALVPWAWGINGCASVISAVLATLLAIHLGFTAVVAIALALYVLAAWTLR